MLDVCGRLLARWRKADEEEKPGIGAVLVGFLRQSLGGAQQDARLLPPLTAAADEADADAAGDDNDGGREKQEQGGEGKGASWGAVLRFVHAVGGTALLGWLLMESSMPWGQLPRTRATARRLLLGDPNQPPSDDAQNAQVQELLLTLALHDLAAAVAAAAQAGMARLTLDSAGGVAWAELSGVPALLDAATGLAAASSVLGDNAVARACLRAAPAVVKHLVLQDVPLVVKGPFFSFLEATRPRVLARALAAVVVRPSVSGSAFLFETPQLLRLLGPWGLGLAQEMGRFLAKNEKLLLAPSPSSSSGGGGGGGATAGAEGGGGLSVSSRAAVASSPVPPTALAAFRSPSMSEELEGFAKDSSPSKALVRLFLAARFDGQEDEEEDDDGGDGGVPCPDAFPWRQLLAAELLGLDLDSMEEGGGSDDADSLAGSSEGLAIDKEKEGDDAAAWLRRLAGALPCGADNAAVRRLARLLSAPAASQGAMEWEWALRWLLPRLNSSAAQQGPNRNPAAVAAGRLVKAVCLAKAGGGRRVGEAVDTLFGLLGEARCPTEAAADVLMGFGRALFSGAEDAEPWRLVLVKAAAAAAAVNAEEGTAAAAETTAGGPVLNEALVERLSRSLSPRALVQAIPDDADVDQVLELLEGGVFLSMVRGGGDGGGVLGVAQ